AGDAQPQGHVPEPAGHPCPGRDAIHRALRIRRAGAAHGGRVHALAGAARPEPGKDGDARRDPAPALAQEPHAYFHKVELTREDYLSSRMVAYPFCLYDCDIPVQGAVAIVLTTADRARDLRPRPAYIAGYGQRLAFEVAGRIGSLSSYMDGGRS